MTTTTTPTTAGARGPLSAASAVMIVLAVAAVPRLLSLGCLTLIITNDGTEYLRLAMEYHDRGTMSLSPLRTPGYPLFLAAVFGSLGEGPVAVLIAQHILGCATCCLIAFVACRLAGPRWGLLAGILCCLDPWLLAFECYALSETLAVFTLTVCVAVVLCWTRPTLVVAPVLGVLMAAACLVRPAGQVLVPFLALAWILRDWRGWRRAASELVLIGIGLAIPLAPWLRYNFSRGVRGVAAGYVHQQWMSLAHWRLLDDSFPLEGEVAEAYKRVPKPPNWDSLFAFAKEVDAWGCGKGTPVLQAWSRASIRANPGPYLKTCLYSLGWNLGYYAPNSPCQYDQEAWFLKRVSQKGSGVQFEGHPAAMGIDHFVVSAKRGWIRRLLRWRLHHHVQGLPQIPLFVLALGTVALGLWRRRWDVLLVFTATIMSLLLHVSILMPTSRYTLPSWTIWYLGIAALPMLLRRRRVSPPALAGEARPVAP